MKLYLPFDGKVRLTSKFGWRTINGTQSNHKGIDLVGMESKNIIAPCDGVITTSTIITNKNNLTWQWGNYVRLDTDDGYVIFMCHMSQRIVKAGQRVKRGDIIGVEGNTGYSFGSHCHFEVRKNGVSIDPTPFLGISNAEGIYINKYEETPVKEECIEEDCDMTGEEIYAKLIAYLSAQSESDWSLKEGGFTEITEKGIMNGKTPCEFVTREQLAAVIKRLGLLK